MTHPNVKKSTPSITPSIFVMDGKKKTDPMMNKPFARGSEHIMIMFPLFSLSKFLMVSNTDPPNADILPIIKLNAPQKKHE